MKTKLVLLFNLVVLYTSTIAFGQCTYCTDLQEALKNPTQVESLDLRGKGLTKIPTEINQLKQLKRLDLSENFLTTFRHEDLSLPQLTFLDLSYNPGFVGMDLKGLELSFPQLQELDLEGNRMNYLTPELAKNNRLQKLNLAYNNFQTLPFEFSQLNLTDLDLSNNRLIDVPFVSGCWKLESIDVSGNSRLDLFQLGRDLRQKDSLNYFCFTPNKDKKAIPKSFAELPCKELHIKGGTIRKTNSSWTNNPYIERLTLENCQIPDSRSFMSQANRLKNLHWAKAISLPEQDLSLLRKLDTLLLVNTSPQREGQPKYNRKTWVKYLPSFTDFTTENVSPESSWTNMSMLQNDVTSIVPPKKMTAEISTESSSEITGKLTEIQIPENAFLTNDGSVYQGKATVQLTEYNDPLENALSGAPMVYNNEGTNQLFASSGMISFTVIGENGESLQPNPNSVITATMRNTQPTQTANLYSFNEKRKNWDPMEGLLKSNNLEIRQRVMDSINALSDSSLVYFNEISPIIYLKFKKKNHGTGYLHFNTYRRYSRLKRKKDLYVGNKIYYNRLDERFISDNLFVIDTLLSEEMLDKLNAMKKSYKDYYKKLDIIQYSDDTRCLLENLKLTIDPANDNYRMTFTFKDESFNLPVIYNYGNNSIQQVQSQEKKRLKKYEKAVRKSTIEEELAQAYKDSVFTRMANRERARLLTLSGAFPNRQVASTDQYTFPIQTFGLMNCDYFYRNPPEDLLACTQDAISSNGVSLPMNGSMLMVNTKDNFYAVVNTAAVPKAKGDGMIYFFKTENDEIAVVKRWRPISDGKVQPVVVTFSMKNKSMEEITDEIHQVNASTI